MQVNGIEYVELYVGNAHQSAHYYRTAFGFSPIAFSALETGEREKTSLLMQQNNIRLILTSALKPESHIAQHVMTHGDSVKDIALSVTDARQAFKECLQRGAQPVMEPQVYELDGQKIVKATVATCGDTVHSLIERSVPNQRNIPNYQRIKKAAPAKATGLAAIDHIAICVNPGEVDTWVNFYQQVFDFQLSHQEDITTEYSGMNSKVVHNQTGRVKFPIMEPAPGKRRSQIEEYLTYHRGPGAQHIAFLSGNIANTVRKLNDNGIDFLSTPGAYYECLESRIGKIDEDLQALRSLNLLVDCDQWGYLMQIFTKHVQGRPTSFFEIIQRKGARGFGGGNIKALFEALEREQACRGNL
jgi:4-hydroxyphenylpyruvate dioxygenase